MEPLWDESILRFIRDMQNGFLIVHFESGNLWFLLILYFGDDHLENVVTNIKTRENKIFIHVYGKN